MRRHRKVELVMARAPTPPSYLPLSVKIVPPPKFRQGTFDRKKSHSTASSFHTGCFSAAPWPQTLQRHINMSLERLRTRDPAAIRSVLDGYADAKERLHLRPCSSVTTRLGTFLAQNGQCCSRGRTLQYQCLSRHRLRLRRDTNSRARYPA